MLGVGDTEHLEAELTKTQALATSAKELCAQTRSRVRDADGDPKEVHDLLVRLEVIVKMLTEHVKTLETIRREFIDTNG